MNQKLSHQPSQYCAKRVERMTEFHKVVKWISVCQRIMMNINSHTCILFSECFYDDCCVVPCGEDRVCKAQGSWPDWWRRLWRSVLGQAQWLGTCRFQEAFGHIHQRTGPVWLWNKLTYYYTTTVLRPFFWDHPGEPMPEEKLLDFMVQGKINRGRHTDHPAGRHSSGLTSAHLHHSPIFLQARCASCCPTYSVKALRAEIK